MTMYRLNAIPRALLLLALPLSACVVDDADEEGDEGSSRGKGKARGGFKMGEPSTPGGG